MNWCTPPEILKALGPFDDDPCPVGGRDGLIRPWWGFVWLNPPYDRDIGKWLERMSEHRNGIALIFARTETANFHRYIFPFADAILFLRGRLHFHNPDGRRAKHNAGAPSCLVGYGPVAMRRLQDCKIVGFYVNLHYAGSTGLV